VLSNEIDHPPEHSQTKGMTVESIEQVARAVVLARIDPADRDTVESLSSRLAEALTGW
jgi:hypothetical protein